MERAGELAPGGYPRRFPEEDFWAGRPALDATQAEAAALRLWGASGLPGSPRGARILDVGCGRGEIVRAFAALGARAVGVDLDPERIAEARGEPGRGPGSARFEALDAATGLPRLAEGAYDLVVCHYAGWGFTGAESVRSSFLSVEAVLGAGRPFVVEIYDGRAVLGAFRPTIAYPGPGGRDLVCRGALTAPAPGGIGRVDQVWEVGGREVGRSAFEPMTPEALSGLAACAGLGLAAEIASPPLPASTPGAARLLLRYVRRAPRPLAGPLHARLHAALSAFGDDTAIADGVGLSGRDCLDFAARTEALLRGLPRGPGTRLAAVVLPRCYAFPLAIMAARAAGYAFLPLDTDSPDERLRGILGRSRPDAVLCLDRDAGRLRGLMPAGHPPRPDAAVLPPAEGLEALCVLASAGRPLPREASHLVFTSGSTGRPKGVLLRERGLLDTVDAQVALLPRGPGITHWLLSPGFDASLSDVLCALLGGRVLRVHRPAPTRLKELRAALARGGVADLPPSMLGVLAPVLPSLDGVVFGGERAPTRDALAVAAGPGGFQAYGPTEASVCAMAAVPRPDWVPGLLGRPLVPGTVFLVTGAGTRHRVEAHGDDPNAVRLVPSPDGDAAEGEIVVAGSPVALGYLDDPEAQATRFGELGGRRAHMTGDLARYGNGRLCWVGRTDRQVKRNGRMVCPEEVEAAAEALAPGMAACCLAGEDALVLALAGPGPVPEGVAGLIAERLGGAFRPSRVVHVDAFPLSGSGKPDLARLAEAIGDA